MLFVTLFLLAFFPRASSHYDLSQRRNIPAQLSCSQSGRSIPCRIGDCATCPVLCDRADSSDPLPSGCSADVDHIEIRDELGRNRCQLNAPPGKLFAWVLEAVLGDRIVSFKLATRDEPNRPILFACEFTPSGLVPFKPPLTCFNCEVIDTSNGPDLIFKNGYFGSRMLLKYDNSQHRIVLTEGEFYVIPLVIGRYGLPVFDPKSSYSTAVEAAGVDMYSDRKASSDHLSVQVSKGDRVELLRAWAPVTMEPVDKRAPEIQIVRYDQSREWLQVRVNGQTGWIRDSVSFSEIGLPLPLSDQ
jgi:hypothetical protein